MRKFFHIFLTLSLLISTAGYAVTKQFCGEILAHVSLGHDTQPCCNKAEMPSGCECESEIDHYAVDDDFQLDHQEVRLTPALQATLVSFIKFLAFAPLTEEHNNNLLPTLKYPPFTEPSIHIRVQSFLL
ncbi:HYC_CC_PP family protein [Nafulsella turpanensis]|uniref:HYC_CC_PP family protein n=1 Tax=Nafulsella turpanensis TaxID=1265690 RepID=UPI0003662C22|nr:hypothetical protein [Nafulsella turpanensis]